MFLSLDFETYFDPEFSLTKMTTEAYVRDVRFQTLCAGIYTPERGKGYIPQDKLMGVLQGLDWSKITLIMHHAHFDGLILKHAYGIEPRGFIDTLSMARAINPFRPLSLSKLAAEYGLEEKSVPYDEFRGKHWSQMTEDLHRRLMEGAAQDAQLTFELATLMMQGTIPTPEQKGYIPPVGFDPQLPTANGRYPAFPREELPVVDMTVKMFTNPVLVGDTTALQKITMDEWTSKFDRLKALGVHEDLLSSNDKFAELLKQEGIEVEYKDGKNGPIPAVAATDQFMQELLSSDEDRVRELAQARVDVKSTIDATRSARLAAMSQRGALPVYLNYFGARNTGRWSGGDKVNFQNPRRGGAIVKAIKAALGYRLIVCDAAQIECRILNYMAGNRYVLELFRTGGDPYCALASEIFHRLITKLDDMERQIGKKGELSCGYGIGGPMFYTRLRAQGIDITLELAQQVVDTYRATHADVVDLWGEGDDMLQDCHYMRRRDWRGLCQWDGDGRMYLPNGSWLVFNLEYKPAERQFYRRTAHGAKKIWGGALVGETIQALARVYLSQTLLRIKARNPLLMPALLKHDEAVYVVPEAGLQSNLEIVQEEFCRVPSWLKGIPLGCEIWESESYGH